MGRVLKRPLAEQDLYDIWDYIADNNIERANTYLRRISASLERLSDTPFIGRLRTELAADLRSFPIEQYVAFYLVIDGGIDLIRMIHGSRDVSQGLPSD